MISLTPATVRLARIVAVLILARCGASAAQPPLHAPGAFDRPAPEVQSREPTPADVEAPEFEGDSQIQGLVTPQTEEIPWDAVVEELVVALFPEEIEGEDNWGDQTSIITGWRFREGRLVPRESDVNHGFWQRYSFSLVEPDETLQIWIDETSSPEPGVFDCHWRLKLRGRCRTQVAHWTLGVKGFNTSTESDVTVVARVHCQLTLKPTFDTATLRPGVEVDLNIRDLSLRLRDIDTRRIGIIGGWVAREMGDGQRRFIEAILQSQEDRIRRRIQEEIDEEL
jgi:hypothetical protein